MRLKLDLGMHGDQRPILGFVRAMRLRNSILFCCSPLVHWHSSIHQGNKPAVMNQKADRLPETPWKRCPTSFFAIHGVTCEESLRQTGDRIARNMHKQNFTATIHLYLPMPKKSRLGHCKICITHQMKCQEHGTGSAETTRAGQTTKAGQTCTPESSFAP